MQFCLRVGSCFVRQFGMSSVLSTVDIARLQFIQCRSIVTEKLVYSEYGDATKVVRNEKENLPAPKANEIVIRMLDAPIDPADINTIHGLYPIKPPFPSIIGNEGVAEVVTVGSGVTDFKEGDRVLPKTNAWGTWRSPHAVCDAQEIIKVPSNIGILEAATMTVNACTAYRMLRDYVDLSRGDTVIQNGASSAVGQNVIQLCRAWGITSVNVVRNRDNSDELKAFLTDLGASYVLTEEELGTTELFKKSVIPEPKLALHCMGGKSELDCLRHLDRGGIIVTYGVDPSQCVIVPTTDLIVKNITVHGFWMTQWSNDHADTPEQADMYKDVSQMYADGRLKAPLDKHFPLRITKRRLKIYNS